MNNFNKFMEEKFVPVASKIGDNKYLKSLSVGSMSLMAIIMVGAIFSLLGNIPWDSYQTFISSTGLKQLFTFAPKITTDLMALYMVIGVAFNAAKIFNHEELAFNNTLLAVASFMILVPLKEIMPEGGFQPDVFINTSYLGSKGIFLGLIIGIIVTKIYCFIVERKLIIKMPDGVPEQVTNAFISLIPAFFILILFSIIRLGFSMTSYGAANDFIYTLLQIPLQNLASSLPTFIILVLLSQILWFFGVHGTYTVLPIFMPIWMGYIGENTAAYAAGQAVPFAFNVGLFNLTTLGGCGTTIGFVISMFFFAKSKRYKAFSKIVMPCGLFNVNEPVVFGMPLMLNPITLIPFLLTPLLVLFLAYFAIKFNIMPAPIGLMIPASTPPIFSGLMQGSWKISVFEVFVIFLSAGIYFPFFKILDNQALKEEAANETEITN
ncbi:PTS sugar transporter subunit IIC [Clostridium intestinale]|uniref:Permease IIC component n=1 Tax=Clostridium intestinale URNW TaxID=1294142 RepID=U2PTQ5_9CLOT|nr:PTS transporter subunit EIIC [Clostridium intestinale]ERK29835.1 cellobiose permease IIC component CelB [Clostridium intestinale URNW]